MRNYAQKPRTLCVMPSARIFETEEAGFSPLSATRQNKGSSPVTAIGVPACTANQKSQMMINISFLLFKNIPAGGIESSFLRSR
jgi:hypothetical protein